MLGVVKTLGPYGPYTGKNNRRTIHVYFDDGRRVVMAYARYLMAQHLGRWLDDDEHVHHINGDQLDDRIENFLVLSHAEHNRLHATERGGEEWMDLTCARCGTPFRRLARHERGNRKRRPGSQSYCTRRCSGIASHSAPSVGTGTRTNFKNSRPLGLEGSNPSSGTQAPDAQAGPR